MKAMSFITRDRNQTNILSIKIIDVRRVIELRG